MQFIALKLFQTWLCQYVKILCQSLHLDIVEAMEYLPIVCILLVFKCDAWERRILGADFLASLGYNVDIEVTKFNDPLVALIRLLQNDFLGVMHPRACIKWIFHAHMYQKSMMHERYNRFPWNGIFAWRHWSSSLCDGSDLCFQIVSLIRIWSRNL